MTSLNVHCRYCVIACLAIAASSPSRAADSEPSIASGIVFLDENANGKRDESEPGIEGVSVSNGIDVVRTDAEGRYEVRLDPEHILFVTKPAAYDVPVNQDNLPQFYYRHYPNGTPAVAEWEWPVIEPTGPLPESIDFPLLPGATSDAFRAMAFADPQTANHDELDMLRKDIIDPLIKNPHGAAFGIVAGDVVHNDLSLYDRYNQLMATLGFPMWNVPGNHDLNFRAPDRILATETFKSIFGPDTYSFDYGMVHVLALNNVDYRGAENGYVYEGRLTDEQITWIRNDLAYVERDRLILIVTHIPLLTHAPNESGERYSPAVNTTNLGDLLNALKGFEHVHAISGHDTSNSWKTEINHEHGWQGRPFIAHTLAEVRGGGWQSGPRDGRGVREATMGDGNPNGYYVLEFEGTSMIPHFIPAGGTRADRLRIMIDTPLVPAGQQPGSALTLDRGVPGAATMVVANFFDGGERDRLRMSIDGSESVEMARIERSDPYVVMQHSRFADTADAFTPPVVSSHIWQSDLPPGLVPGVHEVTITARDEYGQEFEASLTFELESSP